MINVANLSFARAVALQSDGKILLSGNTSDSPARAAVARIDSTASLDTTFGGSGVVTMTSTFSEQFHAVSAKADGKIVAAGQRRNGSWQGLGYVQFTALGALDTAFNGTGSRINSPAGYNVSVRAALVTPTGSIFSVGDYDCGGYQGFWVERLLSTGLMDNTFDADGRRCVAAFGANAFGAALALNPAENFLVVAGRGNGATFAVSRIQTSNGALDTAFNGTGTFTYNINAASLDDATGVIILADDSAIIVGRSNNAVAVSKLTSTGFLDTNFAGGTGKGIFSFDSISAATGVKVDAQGNILICGYSGDGTNFSFLILRLKPNGALDTSFNGTGYVRYAWSGRVDNRALALALQTDGKIIVVGSSDGVAGVMRLMP